MLSSNAVDRVGGDRLQTTPELMTVGLPGVRPPRMRAQDLTTATTVAKISVVSNTAGGKKSAARRSAGVDYSSGPGGRCRAPAAHRSHRSQQSPSGRFIPGR